MMSTSIFAQLREAWNLSFLETRSFSELEASIFLFALILGLLRTVYLLYFHSPATFPGPYQAALSNWWQYTPSKTGKQEETLEQLHKAYGTRALRIGPNELHITEPRLYHTIYSQSYAFSKQQYFYEAFGAPHSVFVEGNKELHRVRRKLLSNFFSKTHIRSMEKTLLSKATLLCDRISETKGNGAINFYYAFRCLTVDLITQMAFGESFNLLTEAEDNTFDAPFHRCFDHAAESLWDMLYFPSLRTIAFTCPPGVAAMFSTAAVRFQALVSTVASTVANLRRLKTSGKSFDHELVFNSLEHLDDELVLAEAISILVAGSDTTAFTLAIVVQQMTGNPAVFVKLRKELRESGITTNEDLGLLRLEQLPYLTVCVKEALRYDMPVPGRLPRVVPHAATPLIVDQKIVPAGTVVGMSAYSMHFDESIWGEDTRSFNPAGWLTEDAKELERYLVTFSKGARQCLGINLAYAEITLTLAMLVNRFRFEPDKTMTESDMRRLDHFTYEFEGSGVRAIVHED
ncbi:cytochrome P450 [Alternaria rosae]|uniref:cytochrome P450 n=1 Tax=Alternaria rosae TaxID=1187941 RepID=UPI001E8E1338|nr:cytochrome P450 [Alternaria rosae]KAH6858880.1 cytochrome P450 [Alternaria rosae]